MSKEYKIEFIIIHNDGGKTEKKCKMKNCMSELHAKVKLEEHIKKTVLDMNRIEIKSCVPWILDGMTSDIFGGEDEVLNNLMNMFGMKK